MKAIYKNIALLMALSLTMANFAEAQSNGTALNVSAGAEYSDNVSRSSGLITDPELDDVVYKGGLDFSVDSRSSMYRLDATGSVERRQYKDGVFDDETIGWLVGDFDWFLAEETLFWNISANHGQQIVDPFQAITPENREDVTIVSTGPTLVLPIGTRTFLSSSVRHSDARYEERPLDSTRLQGGLSLERQIAPTRTLSLNVSGGQVEYDEDQLLQDIDQLNASIGFASETARNKLSIDLGWDYYERGDEDGDGVLLDLVFERTLTESASLRIVASSAYSTNGDIFQLDQELQSLTPSNVLFDPGALDIQGFGDVFRNDYASITYSQSFGRTDVDLSASWEAEEYEALTGLDREITAARGSLSRDLSQTITISAFGSFSNRDYDSGDRTDDDLTYGMSLKASLGRKFSLLLSAHQLKRDSDSAELDYDELRADLSLSYSVL